MISAQTRSAFVAMENRYTLFRILLSALNHHCDHHCVLRAFAVESRYGAEQEQDGGGDHDNDGAPSYGWLSDRARVDLDQSSAAVGLKP
jgi:hypothetical protein